MSWLLLCAGSAPTPPGAPRPTLADTRYRFLALRGFPYLLVYTADTEPPRVLRVLHMARDIPMLLAKPEQP